MVKTKITLQGMKSLTTVIPKAIGEAIRLKPGDHIEWVFINGEVCVRKV